MELQLIADAIPETFNNGGNLRVAYTWSKNLTDDYDGFYQPMDSYNIGRDYGPAPFNKPQVLTVSYSSPLPFWQKGNQWYQKALGGWALTGITSYLGASAKRLRYQRRSRNRNQPISNHHGGRG